MLLKECRVRIAELGQDGALRNFHPCCVPAEPVRQLWPKTAEVEKLEPLPVHRDDCTVLLERSSMQVPVSKVATWVPDHLHLGEQARNEVYPPAVAKERLPVHQLPLLVDQDLPTLFL